MSQVVLNDILARILTAGENPPAEFLPFNYPHREKNVKVWQTWPKKQNLKVRNQLLMCSKIQGTLLCIREENHVNDLQRPSVSLSYSFLHRKRFLREFTCLAEQNNFGEFGGVRR